MTNLTRICMRLATAWVLFTVAVPAADAMVFRSDKVRAHWDTWCFHHDGTYYTYYLITEFGYGEAVGLITSKDGVHWHDHGRILEQSDRNSYYMGSGAVWKSPDFAASGKFIMNYSEHRKDAAGKQTQNILFAWSKDLVHWTNYGEDKIFRIDPRYYKESGRWDCIFAFPRDEGGYWGTWSATGKEVSGTVGIGYSEDGVTWNALPPPVVEVGAKEAGAFYPLNGRLHAMFIAHPDSGIWSYSSDKITGPYRRSAKNPHLLQRGPTAFARFFPTENGLLANHYQWTGTRLTRTPKSVGRDREITYIATFKRIVTDHQGVLRWQYWEGNEALKGKPLPLPGEAADLDLNTGIVLEADVTLPRDGEAPVTINFTAANKDHALRIKTGGIVEMEALGSTGGGWQKLHRADREWKFGPQAHLRVLLRAGMMEVYLDDQFMECWTMMGCYGAKTVDLRIADTAVVKNIKLWQMSLDPAKAPPIEASLRATATASSIYNRSYPAAHAVDGNPGSRWCSSTPFGKTEWLQLDLGETQPLGRVEILWEKAFAKSYRLSVSDNAKDWNLVHKKSGGNGGRDVLNELKTSGRYLRFDLLERGTEHGFSIHEVKVFPRPATSSGSLQGVQ